MNKRIKCTMPSRNLPNGKPDVSSPKCEERYFKVFFDQETGLVTVACKQGHTLTTYHLTMVEVPPENVELNEEKTQAQEVLDNAESNT